MVSSHTLRRSIRAVAQRGIEARTNLMSTKPKKSWLIGFLGLSGCMTINAFDAPPHYFDLKSDLVTPARPTSDRSIAWVDADRILFEGLDKKLRDPVEQNHGAPIPMRALYLWNVRSGEVTRYSKEPLRGSMCFADGFISYSVRRPGRTVRMEGAFGQEKEVQTALGDARLNPFNCRWYLSSTLPKPIVGGGIEPLRDGHGWIEHTGSASWFRAVDGTLTPIADSGRTIGTVRPQKYSEFSGRYVFWRSTMNRTWLLSTNGTVELQPQPTGRLNAGPVEPAADGMTLIRSSEINVRANWDVGDAGLYKFQKSSMPQKLTAGLIDAMQVHMNGCLVAMVVDPWRAAREHELRALDICQ
jgi:hypothetical protein